MYASFGRSATPGGTTAENRVDLAVEPRLDVGILRQQVPGPGQRVGRGLVAGEKDRDRLVAHLRVGHLPAVSFGVRGRDEKAQQIRAADRRSPPLGDHARDRRVDARLRSLEAPVGGQREAVEDVKVRQRHGPTEERDRRGEGVADLVGFRLDVGVEKRPPDDREREPGHLERHVPRLAVLPAMRQPLRMLDHDRAVSRDALVVERGLDHPPLAKVHRILARQEPFAEEPLRALETASLVERRRVGHEKVADEVGPVEQVELDRAEPEADDVAVFARDPREKRQRIAPHREKVASRKAARRPGGPGHRRRPQLAGAPSGRDHSTGASGATPSGRNPSEVWRSDQRRRP